MMLRHLKRNILRQISQTKLPFLLLNPITNGASFNRQSDISPFTVFFFSSSAACSIESPKTDDPLFNLFHTYGFTDAQIKRFIQKSGLRTIETLKPKIEHLVAFGFSCTEIVKIITSNSNSLCYSLEKRMVPNLSLLAATFGSKDHVRKAIVACSGLMGANLEKCVMPNIKILKDQNVIPVDKLTYLFTMHPFLLFQDPNLVTETVNKLKALGMRPSSSVFIHAIRIMAGLKKETWDKKMKLYQSFGWSEEDTLLNFSRQPMCMGLSEEKIIKQIKFFTEKLHWDNATLMLKWPFVLTYSLEKRIIPRCAVLSMLAKNGLWNGKPKLLCLLSMGEKDFEKRFVDKYEKEVPQVVDAYQGKVDFVGFESSVLGL